MSLFANVLVPILMIVGSVAAITLVVLMLGKVFKAIGWVLGRIFRFVGSEISDAIQLAGTVIASAVFIPLSGVHAVFGRWSAAQHYGKAAEGEMTAAAKCIYRLALANPLRLVGMSGLIDGVERRVPDVVAHAPGPERPSREMGGFEGYRVVGSLPSGGSGAKLFVAKPDSARQASFAQSGAGRVPFVVLKTFSLKDGSALPQIVRESRALEAAKRLGLVLDHGLNEHRFYYAMPYVPGENLRQVAGRMHHGSGGEGLRGRDLGQVLSWTCDLLLTLDRYHQGGLWHKDVKPDNIVISEGRAHLVDLGLVTPLRSAMTLTTHGTEYFRDPEMVRMAMRGAKVHEVDGVKFDLYGVGAVLFSALENSFPAHGGLSTISKECPEALRWIVRRAMADTNGRYGSAQEMLADVRAVLATKDAFALIPADLPSVSGAAAPRVGPAEPPRVPTVDSIPAATLAAGVEAIPEARPEGFFARAEVGKGRTTRGFYFRGRRREKAPAAPNSKDHSPRGAWRGVAIAASLLVLSLAGLAAFFTVTGHETKSFSGPLTAYSQPFARAVPIQQLGQEARLFVKESQTTVREATREVENGIRGVAPRVTATQPRTERVFGAIEAYSADNQGPWIQIQGNHTRYDRKGRIGREKVAGTVLVIQRVRSESESLQRQAAVLPHLWERLEEQGFRLAGIDGRVFGWDEEVNLEGSLQRHLKLYYPSDRSDALRLDDFFAGDGQAIDAVVWVDGKGDDPDRLRAFVVFRDGFDPALLLDHLSVRAAA